MIDQSVMTSAEREFLRQPSTSHVIIFVRSIVLCLIGEKEDGFHKALAILRKSHENTEHAATRTARRRQASEKELIELIKRLEEGNNAAWIKFFAMAKKHKDEALAEILLKLCPCDTQLLRIGSRMIVQEVAHT